MPRTRAAKAKLAEEGVPPSPPQSLSNEQRRPRRARTQPPELPPPPRSEELLPNEQRRGRRQRTQPPSLSPPAEAPRRSEPPPQPTQYPEAPPPSEELLPTQQRKRRRLRTKRTSQSPPAEGSTQSEHPTQPTQDATTPFAEDAAGPPAEVAAVPPTKVATVPPVKVAAVLPSEELSETSTARPQTRRYRASEAQTQSRTYRTGESQTSNFPPYGLPPVPFPDHSQVHVQLGWNNSHLQEHERVLSLNLPADVLPAMLAFITQHPKVADTDLLHQLEASPLFQQLLRDHDNDRVRVLTVVPGAKKRKREKEQTIQSILEAQIQKDQAERDRLRTQNPTASATDRERLRQTQIEETQNVLQECRASRSNEPRRKRICTKLILDPYDENGNFRLGRFKEVEFEVDDGPEEEQGLTNTQEQTDGNSFTENMPPQQHEPASTNDAAILSTETADTALQSIEISEDPYNESEKPYEVVPLEEELVPEQQLQTQTEAEPATPRARGWGFSRIIPASVSKLISFSARREAPAITPSLPPAQSEPQVVPQVENEPYPPVRGSYLSVIASQNWQDLSDPSSIFINGDLTRNSPAVDTTQHHQAATPEEVQQLKEELEQELRAKIEAQYKANEAAYKAKKLEESEKLTAAFKQQEEDLRQQEEDLDKRDERLNRERKKIAQRVNEIFPGKRKRMPSPEVIPNPPGGGFGMDLDYFYVSDSDEEDETPIRKPLTKKARTSSHGRELVGSPSGTAGEASSTSQSEFQHNPPKEGAPVTPTQGSQTGRASSDLNGSLHRNVFAESLSAEKDPNYAPNGPTMTFKVPSPTSSDDDSALDLEPEHDIAAPVSPLASKSTVPEQRPTPDFTTKPTPSHLIEKARSKALMHQPKTGSSLRNASRLSTSTVASDLGEEQTSPAEEPAEQPAEQPREEQAGSAETPAETPAEIPAVAPTEAQIEADGTAQDEAFVQNFLTTHVNSYDEFMQGVSPNVAAYMETTWSEEDTEAAEEALEEELEGADPDEAEALFRAWRAGKVPGAAAA
ncbi:hypothetical protein JMJ35_002906 [Cladonia borealis]|uniref:Uncharacterized protein n=1 Tax=Cladonia borealis TaxID=184061 RepID=A0AA39V6J0_9LECA|nr:hypothetical protein JMJ35_002906 [Cladonia borealis]